jgi:hypothetical protein
MSGREDLGVSVQNVVTKDIKETQSDNVNWIHYYQVMLQWQTLVASIQDDVLKGRTSVPDVRHYFIETGDSPSCAVFIQMNF